MEATIREITPAMLADALPPLYSNEDKSPTETKVPVKFFNPVGGQTWWLTEYDAQNDIAFGYMDMGTPELGYISIAEMREVRLPWGLCIERDIHWNEDTTLASVMGGAA